MLDGLCHAACHLTFRKGFRCGNINVDLAPLIEKSNQIRRKRCINGSLSATRFDGAIRGKFPADGEWHTLQIPTEGCRAYRIMAGCGKLKSGQYALVEATAIHCYGKHRKIRTNQSWFGSSFNKIKFRWYGPGQKCKLQLRSGRDYGDNIFVCFQITDLWKDYRMDASDRRNTFNQE